MQSEFASLARFPTSSTAAPPPPSVSALMSHDGSAAALRSIACPLYLASCSLESKVSPALTPPPPEPLEYVWRARVEWEQRLRFELRGVSRKQGRPLVQLRGTIAQLADTRPVKSVEVAAPSAAEFQVRFVYTAEDLLEVLCAIRNPNQLTANHTTGSSASTSQSPSGWNMIQLELPVPTLPQLVAKYAALSPSHRQVGVDDTVLGMEWFIADRQRAGEELLAAASASTASHPTAGSASAATAALRHFAKTGLPSSLRPAFWSRMLAVSLPLSSSSQSYYHSLLSSVQSWSLLSDDLLQFDVADGPGDDEAFFVFHEQLEEMMLAFSRDDEVPMRATVCINSAPILAAPSQTLKAQIDQWQATQSASRHAAAGTASNASSTPVDLSSKLLSAVPPNRIIPFHRLVYFAPPFCFLYARPSEAYFVFRAAYCRLFCRLSIISSATSGILALSRCFETLLVSRAPHLVYKCVSLGVSPLQCSFGWLFSAFSGFLEVDQLLLLWDRLLAYDSLDLVAVLAAAIFLWREPAIMRANTRAELQECMRELVHIKVVPLLQHFLFAG